MYNIYICILRSKEAIPERIYDYNVSLVRESLIFRMGSDYYLLILLKPSIRSIKLIHYEVKRSSFLGDRWVMKNMNRNSRRSLCGCSIILLSQVDTTQKRTALIIEHGARFSRCHSSIAGQNRRGKQFAHNFKVQVSVRLLNFWPDHLIRLNVVGFSFRGSHKNQRIVEYVEEEIGVLA